jgi:hypothetical protein
MTLLGPSDLNILRIKSANELIDMSKNGLNLVCRSFKNRAFLCNFGTCDISIPKFITTKKLTPFKKILCWQCSQQHHTTSHSKIMEYLQPKRLNTWRASPTRLLPGLAGDVIIQ